MADPALGWGRTPSDRADAGVTDERVRQLVAAVREEVRTPRTDARTLERFLADAASLETTFKTMLIDDTEIVRVEPKEAPRRSTAAHARRPS